MRRSNSCLPPGRSFHGCSTIKNLAKEVARDAVAAARHSFLRRNGLPECALQDSLLVVRIARSIFLSSSFSGAVHFVRLRTKKWSLAQCCCCRCRLLVGTVGLPVLGVRTRRTCRDATGGQRNRAVNFSAIGSCARVSILPPPPPLSSLFVSLFVVSFSWSFPLRLWFPLRISLDLCLAKEFTLEFSKDRADCVFHAEAPLLIRHRRRPSNCNWQTFVRKRAA